MSGKNLGLLALVIVVGVLSYLSYANNFSFSKFLKSDSFSSPSQKPSSAWERNWEAERAK